jgi:hypothetical protein
MPNFLAGQTKASNGPNKELQLYLKDKKELRELIKTRKTKMLIPTFEEEESYNTENSITIK